MKIRNCLSINWLKVIHVTVTIRTRYIVENSSQLTILRHMEIVSVVITMGKPLALAHPKFALIICSQFLSSFVHDGHLLIQQPD